MANTIKGLLPSGHLPSVAKTEVQGMITASSPDLSPYATKEELGKTAVGMPIFATRAEALEYEALNVGKKALYIGDSTATDPATPPPTSPTGAVPTDFSYQWLGSDFTATGWKDTKQGLVLTPSDSLAAAPTKSGATAVFSTKAGMRAPGALALGSGAKTLTVVAKLGTVTSSLWGVAGNPSTPTLALPGGGGVKAGWYPGGSITATNVSGSADTGMHVMTVRIDGDSSTLTHDRVTVAARSAENTQFSTFQIGGQHYGGIFQGAVAEVRIYNRRITDDELTALHDSLGGKYGIAF